MLISSSRITQAYANTLASIDAYQAQVASAISKADNFYDSIVSTTGIITWVIKNFNVFNNNLCGKTSPDWCSFSKSSWKVAAPSLPDFPTVISIPDASAIWGSITNTLAPISANTVIDANDRIITKQLASSQYLQMSLGNLYNSNDYNPPQYNNLSSDRSSQIQRTQMLLKNVSSQLNTNTNGNSNSSVRSSSSDHGSVSSSSSSLSDISIIKRAFTKDTVDIGIWFISFSNLR